MHLRQLQLGLCAHARREGRVADDVAEGLSGFGATTGTISNRSRIIVLDILLLCTFVLARGKQADGGRGLLWSGRMGRAYLSASCFSYTFRLVWSRMTLMLTKQPRSSFFARNIDILGRASAGGTSVVGSDVGDRQKRYDAMSKGWITWFVAYVSAGDMPGTR